MQIHETAFIVSTYRSLHPEVSKDPYAHLWNNAKTNGILPEILSSISEHEPFLHSIRNRFFIEKMVPFFKQHPNGTLINFGSGFSMYQFVLPETVLTIEIDKEDILQYKKEKITEWMNDGTLPKRKIEYLSMDFNAISMDEKIHEIQNLLSATPTFILLEGVLFFLNSKTTDSLFEIFRTLQKRGDLLGSVSYDPEVEATKIYQRLLQYFDKNNSTNDTFAHQTLPVSFYQNQKDYMIIKYTDEFETARHYASQYLLPEKSEVLNESLIILKKR